MGPADATLGWPGACPSCPAGGGGEPRVELPAPRVLFRRLVGHRLDRRQVFGADRDYPGRCRPGGIVASRNSAARGRLGTHLSFHVSMPSPVSFGWRGFSMRTWRKSRNPPDGAQLMLLHRSDDRCP